jgi:hypothetical protein
MAIGFLSRLKDFGKKVVSGIGKAASFIGSKIAPIVSTVASFIPGVGNTGSMVEDVVGQGATALGDVLPEWNDG